MEKKKRGGGRKKGVPNKLTATIKSMIEAALSEAGGVKYLVKQAQENPGPFMALVGKLLPMQVNADVTNHVARMPEVSKDKSEWARQYTPTHDQPATRQ